MRRLLLIGCSATKRPDPGLMPAIERYDGPVYRTIRAHRAAGHRLPAILILSAQYGFISADHPIADYDLRMTADLADVTLARNPGAAVPAHMARHRARVRDQVETMIAAHCHRADGVLVCCGRVYRAAYLDVIPRCSRGSPLQPPEFRLQVARGGIGEQLGQLKRWLRGEVRADGDGRMVA